MVETEMVFDASVQSLGDGSFLVKPGQPVKEVAPKQAARMLGISRAGVYRLLASGLIKSRRASPGKIVIKVRAIQAHIEATRDPRFWDRVKAERVQASRR